MFHGLVFDFFHSYFSYTLTIHIFFSGRHRLVTREAQLSLLPRVSTSHVQTVRAHCAQSAIILHCLSVEFASHFDHHSPPLLLSTRIPCPPSLSYLAPLHSHPPPLATLIPCSSPLSSLDPPTVGYPRPSRLLLSSGVL